jgi:carbon monoxide dehydrogenase subunit G
MTHRIECSVTIQAPPEVVWEIIQDFSHRTKWDERVVAASELTPPPKGKGTRFRIVYGALGVRSWVEIEYVTWDPPRRSGVRTVGFSRASLFKSAAGSWHFHHNEDGSTTWTTKVSMSMRGGRLAPLFEKVFIGWYFTRLTIKSQENLKRLIEAESHLYLNEERPQVRRVVAPGRGLSRPTRRT